MRYALILALLVSVPAFSEHRKQLFNGKNMDGWKFVPRTEGEKGFAFSDGLLQTGGAKGMLLYTPEKIGNATIRIVYKMSNEKGNSGVFIRVPVVPSSETVAIHKGIEVQIDDRDDEWHCTGTLYSMTKALARPSKPAHEWNTMEITLDGLRTIVHVNGLLVTDYDGIGPVPERKKQSEPERGPRPETGYIALQNHDPSAVVSFKEVSVEPLKAARKTRTQKH
jgi:hypothetical protein